MAMMSTRTYVNLNTLEESLPGFGETLLDALSGKFERSELHKVNCLFKDTMKDQHRKRLTFPIGRLIIDRKTTFKLVDKMPEFHPEYVVEGKDPLKSYDICVAIRASLYKGVTISPRLCVSTKETISPSLEMLKLNYDITGVDIAAKRIGVIGDSTAFGFTQDALIPEGVKLYSYEAAIEEASVMSDRTKHYNISNLDNLLVWSRGVSKSRDQQAL